MDSPSTSTRNDGSENYDEMEIKKRDEFFQTVADLLEPVVKDDDITVEELREVCYRYALKQDWVRSAVIASVKNDLKVKSEVKCPESELKSGKHSDENDAPKIKIQVTDFESDENYFNSETNEIQNGEQVFSSAGKDAKNAENHVRSAENEEDAKFKGAENDLESDENYFDSAEHVKIAEHDVERCGIEIKGTETEIKSEQNDVEDTENDDSIWNAYLFAIQCSATDLMKMKNSDDENILTLYTLMTRTDFGDSLRAPIPGKVDIEGRIICDVFDVILNLEENKVIKKSEIYDSFTSLNANLAGEMSYENPRYSNNSQRVSISKSAVGKNQIKKKAFAISFNPFASFTSKSKSKHELEFGGKIPEPIEIPQVVLSDQEIKLRVNDRLEKFVRFFVKEFETKLASYVLLSNGEVINEDADFQSGGSISKKIGQILGKTIFGAIGGAAGALIGFPGAKTGAELGSKLGGKVVDMIEEKQRNKMVKNLEDLIDYYLAEKSEFTKLLCEVGFDIFQSFEMQLMRVSGDKGVKEALHLLATDAVNRIMSFIGQNKLTEEDENAAAADLHYLLIEGLKWGKSKRSFLHLRCRGYEITYESINKNKNNSFKEIQWTTACVYENTGIVTTKDERVFFRNKRSGKTQTEKYGYRRLFRTEIWQEMSPLFQREMNHFENYRYFLRAKDMKAKAKKIFSHLDDKSLEEERVKSIMKESKEEMLEGIIMLKGMQRDFAENLQRLTEFEESLKKLKIEEHVNKLETFFQSEEKYEAKIQELLDKINEMDKKIDKLCQFNEEKTIMEENFDFIS